FRLCGGSVCTIVIRLSLSLPHICFFQCPGRHRNLHSFPTRRSSDLRRGCACGAASRSPRGTRRRTRASTSAATSTTRTTSRTGRSEEHTSELQSRENLVCRLLLEKKNKMIKFQGTTTDSDDLYTQQY